MKRLILILLCLCLASLVYSAKITKYYCDRCTKEVKSSTDLYKFEGKIEQENPDKPIRYWYELCSDCRNNLDKLIDNYLQNNKTKEKLLQDKITELENKIIMLQKQIDDFMTIDRINKIKEKL